MVRKIVGLLGGLLLVLAVLNSCLSWVLPDIIRSQLQSWNKQHPEAIIKISSIHWSSWPWRLEVTGLQAFDCSNSWLEVRQAAVGIRPFSLLHRHIHVSLIRLVDGHVNLAHQPAGWNVVRLYAPQSGQKSTASTGFSWGWSIGFVDVRNIGMYVQYPEIGWVQPFHFLVHHVQLTDLNSSGSEPAPLEIHLQNLNQNSDSGILYGRMQIQLQPLDLGIDFVLANVDLLSLQPLLQTMPIRIESGTLKDLHVQARLQQQDHRMLASLPGLGLHVQKLKLSGWPEQKQRPELGIDDLQLKQMLVDPAQHFLALDGLVVKGLSVHAHQTRPDSVDILDLVHALVPPSPSTQPSWGMHVQHVAVQDANLSLATFQDPQAHLLHLSDLDIQVPDMDTRREDAAWPVHVHFKGGLGRWEAYGSVNPKHLSLDWHSYEWSLAGLNPWLPAGIKGIEGQLSSHGQLKGNALAADLSLQFQPDLQAVQLTLPTGKVGFGQANARVDWKQSIQDLKAEAQLKRVSVAQNNNQLNMEQVIVKGLHQKGIQPDVFLESLELSNLQGSLQKNSARIGSFKAGAIRWHDQQLNMASMDLNDLQGNLQGISAQIKTIKAGVVRWHDQQLNLASMNLTQGQADWQAATANRLRFSQVQLLNSQADLNKGIGQTGFSVQGLNWHGQRHWFKNGLIQEPQVTLDWNKHQLQAGILKVQFAGVHMAMDPTGQPLMLADLPKTAAAPSPSVPSMQASQASQAWNVHVQGVRTDIAHVRLEDKTLLSHPVRFGAVRLHTAKISSSKGCRSVHLVAHLAEGGRIAWRGSVGINPLALDGMVHVQDIPLHVLQPVLDTQTDLIVDHGDMNVKGQLAFDASGVVFKGGFHLDDTTLDNKNGLPILSWSQIDEPLLSLSGQKLILGTVLIDHPYALVRINPDKSLNWNQMIHPVHGPAQPNPTSTAAMKPSAAMPVTLQGVQLIESAIDFTDASLPTPFHVLLHHLDGQMGALNSQQPDQWSTLHLQGRVNQFGKVQMDGQLQPLLPSPRADVHMSLRDLEMPTLNPYSMAFAGYRIDQGMLNLQLDYILNQGRVNGKNHFRIDQLQLGPRISGSDAPDLPLKLAVDVLRNNDGVIDLDVPVYGNLNDPEFNMRKVVMAAIGSSLKHIVDSPITLLSHLLGESEDALHHVTFDPGSYKLTQETRDRISRMAKVLNEHQRLLVFVRASYDPVLDSPKGQQGVLLTPQMLRDLAIHRAESVKSAFMANGVHDHRIFIDEPGISSHRGTAASVVTSIEIQTR